MFVAIEVALNGQEAIPERHAAPSTTMKQAVLYLPSCVAQTVH